MEQGVALTRTGNYRNAITILREATKERQDDADAWCALGIAYGLSDQPKDGQKALRTALRLRPNFPLAHSGLALSALQLRQNELAMKESELARSMTPDDIFVRFVHGLVLLTDGAEPAISEADFGIKADPKFELAYLLRRSFPNPNRVIRRRQGTHEQ